MLTKSDLSQIQNIVKGEIQAEGETIRKELRSEIQAEGQTIRKELGSEIQAEGETIRKELRSEIQAEGQTIRKELNIELEPLKKDMKTVKSELRKVRKTVDVMAKLFDETDVKLYKRVKRIEEHLRLPNP